MKRHSGTADSSELYKQPHERSRGKLVEHSNGRFAGELDDNHNGVGDSRELIKQYYETVSIKLVEHSNEIIGGDLADTHSSTDDEELVDHGNKSAKHHSSTADSRQLFKHPYERPSGQLVENPNERFAG